jgi:hypothetical protein
MSETRNPYDFEDRAVSFHDGNCIKRNIREPVI